MSSGINPLDTESAGTLTEAVRDARFTPWQLIILILGGIILWNAKGFYQIHVQKYETKRKYDDLDKKRRFKIKMLEEKKKAKAERGNRPKKKPRKD